MREQGLGSSIALQVTVSYVSEPDSISYFFFLIRINKKHLIKQLKRGSKKKKKKHKQNRKNCVWGKEERLPVKHALPPLLPRLMGVL